MNDERVDLTKLIGYAESTLVVNPTDKAMRDEIVLALRERRVACHPSTLWAAFYGEHGMLFQIQDSDGGEALRTLDFAERILGYGGSDD